MLTVRHIQMTTDEEGAPVPATDAEGGPIVLWSVEVPMDIEFRGPAAIDAYVATVNAGGSATDARTAALAAAAAQEN